MKFEIFSEPTVWEYSCGECITTCSSACAISVVSLKAGTIYFDLFYRLGTQFSLSEGSPVFRDKMLGIELGARTNCTNVLKSNT